MTFSQIVFIVAGVITIVFGISNVALNSRRMQRMVRLIGVVPTRILYIIIGIALIVIAFTVDLGTV